MKKFFSLSACIAIVAMLMTSVTISSCSKDDDDNDSTIVKADSIRTFEVTMGGSTATSAGSYLSVEDEKVYKTSDIKSDDNTINIVFDGKKFISPAVSSNSYVSGNGILTNFTTVTEGKVYSYKDYYGYHGTITVKSGTMGTNDAVITIIVTRIANANQ
jgi:hypothetical protein